MSLIEEMKKNLPIPIYPTSALVKYLSDKGINIDTNTELNITEVFESGESGGIMAHILSVEGGEIIVSLTHLRVKPGHPLSKKIQSYQKKRMRNIRFGIKGSSLHHVGDSWISTSDPHDSKAYQEFDEKSD